MSQSIACLRAKYGLSQTELARRAGMTQAALSRIERGERYPSLPTAIRLAQALGLTVEELFRNTARTRRIAPSK